MGEGLVTEGHCRLVEGQLLTACLPEPEGWHCRRAIAALSALPMGASSPSASSPLWLCAFQKQLANRAGHTLATASWPALGLTKGTRRQRGLPPAMGTPACQGTSYTVSSSCGPRRWPPTALVAGWTRPGRAARLSTAGAGPAPAPGTPAPGRVRRAPKRSATSLVAGETLATVVLPAPWPARWYQ
jgi:hypothetical protein